MSFAISIIHGNLTKDPELKTLQSGMPVCTFSVAVNYKTKEKEKVSYLDIVVYDKFAETCKKYLTKGKPVIIEARIEQQRWEDASGGGRSKIRFIAKTVEFLSGAEKIKAGGPSDAIGGDDEDWHIGD